MKLPMKWIWLPKENYPESQTTRYSGFNKKEEGNYTVAEFEKTYFFEKRVVSAVLQFSGDTEFQLYCNGTFVATGPAHSGGDFIGNETPRKDFYALQTTIDPDSDTLHFFARVKMMPVRICEYSKGYGGFMLSAFVTFLDGTTEILTTDSTWKVRKNDKYLTPNRYDGRLLLQEYTDAEEIEDHWHCEVAPICVRYEEEICPENNRMILQPHEETEMVLQFDKIYAGFLQIRVRTKGELQAKVFCRELEEEGTSEEFVFCQEEKYRGFFLHSTGNLLLRLNNDAESESEFEISLLSTHYPVSKIATTVTDDEELNRVLDVCRHTLKICRQLHHLDSPRHCEPLACTGDYYIETLMTLFSFGDMDLAEFDVRRTAQLLRNNDGRMFHTTYSLIWIKMLYEVYLFTGKKELLSDCCDALYLLLHRFETYLGENGLVETPPDYMFVDWIYIDEISMHHPPKALGQTCLNLFYYGGLEMAEKVFEELGQFQRSKECEKKRCRLKKAINSLLYDKERGLYFEGLNTPTPEHLIDKYMPRNTEKRYYLKHSNLLSEYFGVCEERNRTAILEKIMNGDCPGDVQPYFMHYLLEAVYQSGLREEYTRRILEAWKKPVAECSKGLVEGFV